MDNVFPECKTDKYKWINTEFIPYLNLKSIVSKQSILLPVNSIDWHIIKIKMSNLSINFKGRKECERKSNREGSLLRAINKGTIRKRPLIWEKILIAKVCSALLSFCS